jgi:hypothetical protein
MPRRDFHDTILGREPQAERSMTRSSLTAWFVSGALALALASGGCSSNSPHYVGSGDGPTVQEDGPREAGHGDAVVHTDGEVPDAELPDGEVPDAGLESGPIPDGGTNQPPTVEFTLPATGSSYKGSMVIQFTAKDPDDGLAATAPAITIDGRPVTLTLLSTDDGGAASPQPTAGELTW